ncbi:MAG: penicillin-binding protein activator, partial [Streptosporangiales bacterium]|nr:penicillin-binding protein activator [Streptosporangiales bacterium]
MSNRLRRRAITAAAVLTLGVAASACGGGGGGGSDSVSVGFELPLSGNFSANGHNEQNGFELGLHDFGRSVNGHKINVKYVDTHADPATALTDARNLIQTDHIDVFEGPLAANEIGAVTPFVGQQGVPVDDLSFCSSQQYTDYNKFGNGITSGWGCDQPALAGGEWAAKEKHWKHIVAVGQDFSFGWEVVGGFAAGFKQNGGTIDKYIWVPNNATDLSAYMSQIPKNTDAVYAEMSGALAVKFTKLYESYGLKSKVPLLGITQLTDYSVLPSESASAINGVYTDAQYCDGISTSANQKFTSEYKAKYHTYPGYYSDAG